MEGIAPSLESTSDAVTQALLEYTTDQDGDFQNSFRSFVSDHAVHFSPIRAESNSQQRPDCQSKSTSQDILFQDEEQSHERMESFVAYQQLVEYSLTRFCNTHGFGQMDLFRVCEEAMCKQQSVSSGVYCSEDESMLVRMVAASIDYMEFLDLMKPHCCPDNSASNAHTGRAGQWRAVVGECRPRPKEQSRR